MTWYDPDIEAPRTSTILDLLKGRLLGDTDLEEFLQGSGRIFRQRRFEEATHALVVREEETPGKAQTFTGQRPLRVQAAAYCPVDETDIDKWHEAVQDRVYGHWTGFRPSLSKGRLLQPIHRIGVPTAPFYEDNRGQYISVSTWLVVYIHNRTI